MATKNPTSESEFDDGTNVEVKDSIAKNYQYGFITDIESETAPKGLNEDIIRFISNKKNEPEWLLEWRLKAYKHFLLLVERENIPEWANIKHDPIDFQDMYYYSEPKPKKELKSLDEVDPELLATYEKLGIPIAEQKKLAGVAVDAIFDSVSIATTFKEELSKYGVICVFLYFFTNLLCSSIPAHSPFEK